VNRGSLPATGADLSRQGINLDRSTLADYVGRAAWYLRPVYERLLAHIRSSLKILADELTAPVLDPGRGRTKTGQLWTYARDNRPVGGADPPAVAYVYAPDRKGSGQRDHFAGFIRVMTVTASPAIPISLEATACNWPSAGGHVRRRFHELAAAGPLPIASEAFQRIAGRYTIDDQIPGHTSDQRSTVRWE
jgi:transposase